MKLNYVLLILLFSAASCSTFQKEVDKGFVVKGVITNASEISSISIFELTAGGLVLLDSSAITPDGKFELDGKLSEKTYCAIRLPKGDILLLLDTTGTVNINADMNQLENYVVDGLPENSQLKDLYKINQDYMLAAQKLEARFSSYGNDVPPVDVQNEIRAQFDSLQAAQKAAMKDFSMKVDNSMLPYFTTSFMMPDADFEFFQLIDAKLYNKFHGSKYAEMLHKRVADLSKTAPGSMAPEIVMSDPFGKTIALSSLRGKYVLVDFWASWCKPCRDENPNVVKLYNKYKAKGFDVLGVSLDDNRESWINAINKDALLWNHISDLMKWNSQVVSLYNIEGIPFTVLLDKEGKILAKNLRGPALESKLKEIFGY